MKPRLLLFLALCGGVFGLWMATCGGQNDAPLADASDPALQPADPAPVVSAEVEPAQLDLPAREAAADPLSREEAVLGDPSESIQGRVLTASGSPAAEATVSLWTLAADWNEPLQMLDADPHLGTIANTITDARGNFSFQNLLPAEYGLSAEHGRRQERKFPAAPGQYVEIRIGEGGRVRGRLHCETHGAENFTGVVAIERDMFEPGLGAVTVSADGGFTLDSLPLGRTLLCAYVDGHSARSFLLADIRRPGETVDVVIELRPACTVRGKVVDAVTRAPIAGAFVRSGSQLVGAAVRTGSDGLFTLTNVELAYSLNFFGLDDPDPPQHAVDAEAPGYLRGRSEWDLPADETEPQDHHCTIALQPGIRVTGRLLDARGRPLVRVPVELTGDNPLDPKVWPPDLRARGMTDHEGQLELAWSPGLGTLLHVQSDQVGFWIRNLGELQGSRDLGDLSIPDTGAVPVLVLDDSAAPIEAAKVRIGWDNSHAWEQARASVPDSGWLQASTATADTDAAGRCSLLQPPVAGAVIVVEVRDGVQDWTMPFPSRAAGSKEDVRLVLKGIRTLTGRVRHADKTAIRGVMTIRTPGSNSERWKIQTAPDGSFRARASFPDRFEALVLVDEPERVGAVLFHALEFSAKPIELTLPVFLPVQGRVVDRRGNPVAAAGVNVSMDGMDFHASQAADAAGQFRILLPPQGKAQLSATVEQGFARLMTASGSRVEVTAGQSGIVLVAPDPKKKE